MEDEEEGNAHGFLRACCLNQELPVGTRMKAAATALPYERPKLVAQLIATVQANVAPVLAARRERAKGKWPELYANEKPRVSVDTTGLGPADAIEAVARANGSWIDRRTIEHRPIEDKPPAIRGRTSEGIPGLRRV